MNTNNNNKLMLSNKMKTNNQEINCNYNIVYNSKFISNYITYSFTRRLVKHVNMKEFLEFKGTFIRVGKFSVKYSASGGCTRALALEHLNFLRCQAQAGFLTDTHELVGSIVTFVRDFNRVRERFDVVSTYLDTNFDTLKDMVLDTLLIVLEFADLSSFSVAKVIRMCVNIGRVILGYKKLIPTQGTTETLLLLAGAMAMPKNILAGLKNLATFSNIKLFDDCSVVFQFVLSVVEYLDTVVHYVTGCESKLLETFGHYFKIGQHHVLLGKARHCITEAKKDPKYYIDKDNRDYVLQLVDDIKNNLTIQEWSRASVAVSSTLKEMARIHKVCCSYAASSRQEPLCMIFHGKAGSYKSVTMNKLIKSFTNKSRYCHSTRTITDGKDFYDNYQNEEIFYMDDVGQMGVSQWRYIINFVSSVKFPLDCAQAELKDTKFFNSESVLCTTNDFMGLQGLSKADGIADVAALWRRGLVISCDGVGPIKYKVKFYDIFNPMPSWKDGFPRDMQEFMQKRGIVIPYHYIVSEQFPDVIDWLMAIYQVGVDTKASHVATNEESEDLLKSRMRRLERFRDTYEFVDVDLQSTIGEKFNSIKGYLATGLSTTWFCMQALPELLHFGMDLITETFINAFTSWRGESHTILYSLCAVVITGIIKYVFSSKKDSSVSAIQKAHEQAILQCSANTSTINSTVNAIERRNCYTIQLGDDKADITLGVISGHFIIIPFHVTDGKDFNTVTIYKQYDRQHILKDHVPCCVVYENIKEDVIVLEFDSHILTPFKNLKEFFGRNVSSRGIWLINAYGSVPMDGKLAPNTATSIYAMANGNVNELNAMNSVQYPLGFTGLCGSILYDDSKGIIGMHVAGFEKQTGEKVLNKGIAKLWSDRTILEIKSIISRDKFIIANEIKDRDRMDFSGIDLKADFAVNTSTKNTIIPSILYGTFEITKEPANMKKFGPHTVKTVVAANTLPCGNVNEDDLEFAKDYLRCIVPNFKAITMSEVIKGKKNLAPLNKTASTGPLMNPDRLSYVNFDDGVLTELGNDLISNLEYQIDNGIVDIKSVVQAAALKMELRPFSKEGEPRTFMVLRLSVNILLKKLCGEMCLKLVEQRWFNGIMVGMNVYNDFDRMYHSLERLNCIDADYKKYDKKMLAQVQFMVRDVILTKFEGSEKDYNILKFLLSLLINSPTIVNDDLLMTTHALPSGCYLTAIFNSLVNKTYVAMWFNSKVIETSKKRPSIHEFVNNITHYCLGDDMVAGVTDKYKNVCDAYSLESYIKSIGLDLTSASKGAINRSFTPLNEISFLKRTFAWHPFLNKYMCPIDRESFLNSISWVDSSKDIEVVILGKCRALQLEAYLYPDYKEVLCRLVEKCITTGVPFTPASDDYIKHIYEKGEVPYFDPCEMFIAIE